MESIYSFPLVSSTEPDSASSNLDSVKGSVIKVVVYMEGLLHHGQGLRLERGRLVRALFGDQRAEPVALQQAGSCHGPAAAPIFFIKSH